MAGEHGRSLHSFEGEAFLRVGLVEDLADAVGRGPLESERATAAVYLKSSENGLAGLCQALFNLNEFVYVE